MDTILTQMNPWWKSDFGFPGVPRTRLLDNLMQLMNVKDIVIIKGLRRVGKTTLMLQMIYRMIEKGIDPRRILYVSLDNIGLNDHPIHEIVDGYRSKNRLQYDTKATLFLDEVHTSKKWELELKNLYDLGFSKVYASGSQSLDNTMSTANLVGRHRFVNVDPLDFSEYLSFKEVALSTENSHLGPVLMEDYLHDGGIPEYVLGKDINYLNSTIESVLFRELIEKANIRNRDSLVNILKMIARSTGSPLSLRKISRTLDISYTIVSNVVSLFREANLIHCVERAGKFNERKTSPMKIYMTDNGLFNVLAEDTYDGILAENMVANHLIKKGAVYYTLADTKEIDFICGEDAFEVKYKQEITVKDTLALERLEVGGKKTLITYDKEGRIGDIEMIPLWKFVKGEHTPGQ